MQRLIVFLLITIVSGGQAQTQSTGDDAIRSFIKTFADARNTHDGDSVAALYTEDGRWINAGQPTLLVVRGRAELTKLWSGVIGHVDRSVAAIDFPGPNIRVVHVSCLYHPDTGITGSHREVFVLVNESSATSPNWRISLHQTLD
jgi:uncharacterized protein (TIGR02246 family)